MVIDAPHQQEQDRQNHKRMLKFINEKRPAGSQLVLALVEDCGIDFGGKEVQMTEKNFALSELEYGIVAAELEPYSMANLGL